jgi:hypothetical protein
MEKATASFTLFTRWVEVKCEDGTVVKGKKRVTAVRDGESKPAVRDDIAAVWIGIAESMGKRPTGVTFQYRKQR